MNLTAKQVREMFHITNQTLYNWRNSGKIKFKQINSKLFLYELPDEINRINVIYGRVSNTKQKSDMEKQVQIITDYMLKNGIIPDKIYCDIASGMNENRKHFNELMDLVFQNKVKTIFITYKDRLTRFGFSYFEKIFSLFGTNIVILNATKEEDFQQELSQDLISIIHHFSMKLYSNRRKILNDLKKELEINDYD